MLLEIILLLGHSVITCTGQRTRFRGDRYRPIVISRSCIYVSSDGILMCDFMSDYDIPYYSDFSHWDERCTPSCEDSFPFHSRAIYRSLSGRRIKRIDLSALNCMKCFKELDLSRNSLDFKYGDNFQGLSGLKSLKLSNNDISSLAKSTFRSLGSLEELDLNSNRIQSIPVGLFQNLLLLQILNLEDNLLSSLSYEVLSPLTRLLRLNLKNNKLSSLDNTFKNSGNLKVLDLSINSNLTLKNDTFEGLKNLKELLINNCNITSFPINLFKNISGLRDLYISRNRLEEVSFQTFGDLKSLTRFYANSNKISVLRDKPFRNHRNLTVIELKLNKLVYINDCDLEGLSSLRVLRLSSNSIEFVSQSNFKNMPHLDTLELNSNKINSSFSFENNTKLKLIDFRYNKLTDFSFTGLEKLPHLQDFKLNNNDIKNLSIPMLIPPKRPFAKPRFHLQQNKIEKIILMDTNKSLTSKSWNFSVNLEGNPLMCDCHMYPIYKYLGDNTLSHVTFEDILFCHEPPHLKKKVMKWLQKTDFICNIEDSCPYNCECIYRAWDSNRIVNCKEKNYTTLPLEIPPDIHVLNIGHNRLTSLANLKESCWENLTHLYAESNEIIHEEFHMPRNLVFLGLKDNKIEALPEVIKNHAETFKDFKMTLSNNLWRCDCWVLHLKVFLSTYRNQVDDNDSIRCTFPNDTVSSFKLIIMPDSDICPDIHLYVFVMGFLLLILCVYILHRRYKLRISEIWSANFQTDFRSPCCFRVKLIDRSKYFDCFLSYCLEDKSVAMAIVREMNKKEPRYTFCTHERNWTFDCQVTNSVSFSIQSSRSALVVLSEAFAKTEWFQMEFRQAFEQLQKDRRFKLILVIVGDIRDKRDLNVNVQFFFSSGMYLKFGEKWFWHKLREAFRSLDKYVKLNIPQDP